MSKIICYWKNVTEKEITIAITKGEKPLKIIQEPIRACRGNKYSKLNPSGKCCSDYINAILKTSNGFITCYCC